MKKLFIIVSILCLSLSVFAQNSTQQNETIKQNLSANTLNSLISFVEQKNKLKLEIKLLQQKIDESSSETEKKELKIQLVQLKQELVTSREHLKEIAAGVDLSVLNQHEEEAFNFQKELFALIKPAFNEIKEMTAHVRQKSALKETIAYYNERLPVISQAIENIERLQKETNNPALKESLEFTNSKLIKQRSLMQSELNAEQFQLKRLIAKETSLSEASQSWLKSFFQKRGLYLIEVILLIFLTILLSRLSYSAMQRYLPGFRVKHRSFRIRLIELSHRLLTIIFLIMGPMTIFYLVEDWVLFSIGVLLLIGFAWTLRQTLPHYWKQFYLFLNIGSVREGERILLDGLPWKIEKINMYCTMLNPVADLTMRVPIQDLVELKSRPYNADEPWFPCRKNDWVILNDGVRAKVTGISQESIQLVKRGGAIKTYTLVDFLAAAPLNLSSNFRIKETIGISYNLQKDSTRQIPELLCQYLQKQIDLEDYSEQLISIKVEFEYANNSSLDLVIIADFKGETADLYNRLRRAIQRWSVDACTLNNWEIPFPQMTLHKGE